MPYYSLSQPFKFFFDVNGEPLENGYIYIGEANENPITHPIDIYWDNAGSFPATQPVRTLLGLPSYNGTPSNIFLDYSTTTNYSILIKDKNGGLVYSEYNADVADYTSGVLTLTVDPILNNDVYLSCKEVGGTLRQVAGIDATDIFQVGNVNNETNIRSNGTLTHNGNPIEVLSSWEEDSNNFRPITSGVSNIGDTTHLVNALYLGDSGQIYIGDDQDLNIYHNGSDGYIVNDTGDINITCTTSADISFATDSIDRWYVASGGKFHPYTTETYDIGSTALRVNNIYAVGLNLTGDIYQADGEYHYFSNAYIYKSGSVFIVENPTAELRLLGSFVRLGDSSYSVLWNNAIGFYPSDTALFDLGASGARWDTVYSVNALDTSDYRYKKDIEPINLGIDFINELNPISFKLIEKKNDRTRYGLIAQEVNEILSKFGVDYDGFCGLHYDKKNDRWDMDYKHFIAPIIKSIQELTKRIDDL